jgi:uncharacterized protein (TIGR00251 family)
MFLNKVYMPLLTIKVIPRSSQNSIQMLLDGTYKVKLTAAPVDGQANEMLVNLLAKEFSVSKNNIHIIKGASSKVKVVEILS